MINAPPSRSRSDKSDALSEFHSGQRNDDGSGRSSAIAGEVTSEDLNATERPHLTHVFLAASAALDAFDPEEAKRKPNGVAPPPTALADFAASATIAPEAASATVAPETQTTTKPPAASTTLARPRTVTAPPLRPPVVPPIRRPRVPAYLYAAVAIATLIVIAAVLVPLPEPIVEQSAAKQPLPSRNDAPETPRAGEAPEATAIVVDPAPSPQQETSRRPIEQSRTAELVAASPPIALRDAPAASASLARETRPADPPQQSLQLPASQTRSVPVQVTTAAPNLATAAAPDAATTRDGADLQPRSVVAPSVAAPTSTPSTVAALPPGAATTATPPTAAAATPAPAPANSTPAPINGSVTGTSEVPPTPTPTTTTPPIPATASSTLETERGTIRQVLERYRNANNALDARGIQDAWPGVNRRALERAFESLYEQNVSFQSCRIDVTTIKAAAVCGGAVRYVPRVGSRTPRVEQREWTFRLERQRNEWLIEGVDTR